MPHTSGLIEISYKLKAPEFLPDLFPISRCVHVLQLSLVVAASCSLSLSVRYLVKGKGDQDPSTHHLYKLILVLW